MGLSHTIGSGCINGKRQQFSIHASVTVPVQKKDFSGGLHGEKKDRF